MRLDQIGEVARAELHFNAKRPAVWAIALLAAGNAVLWWCAGPAGERGWATNGDLYIARNAIGFALLTAPFLTAALMGDAIARDTRIGVAPLLLASPVGRAEYVLGKFAGNFAALALALGAYAATGLVLQWVPFEGMIVRPWRAAPFVRHFVVLVLVPHAALGALCLAIGTAARSAKAVYAMVTGLYVAYFGAQVLALRALPPVWRVALDPLATRWLDTTARGLGADAFNALEVVYGPALAANRLGLVAATAAFIAWAVGTMGRQEGLAPLRRRAFARTGRTGAQARRRRAGPPFVAAVGAELRLLAAERATVAVVPAVALFSGAFAGAFGSAFGAPLLPLSSIYAANSAQALLWLLGSVAVFALGEMVHRDRALRVEPLVSCAPASNALLLGSKYVAMLLVAGALALLTAATAVVTQLARGAASIDLVPYAVVYTAIVLPGVAIVAGVALAIYVLARDRLLGHAIAVGLGGALVTLFYLGYRSWLYNPVLYGLWTYSDMTGLALYRRGIALHHVYWGAIAAGCFALAAAALPRPTRWGRTTTVAIVAAVAVAVAAGAAIRRGVDGGPEGARFDAARREYEARYRATFSSAPQPEIARVDLRVALEPSRRELSAEGRFELENRTSTHVDAVLVTLPPNARVRELSIDGASPDGDGGPLGRVFRLGAPLAPGERTTLNAAWSLATPPGLLDHSSAYATFVDEGGAFLGGPDVARWYPTVGYMRSLELSSDGGSGQRDPFDLRVEITVPAGETAVSSGRLVEIRDEGDSRTFVYETERPVTGFPILAARYAELRRGDLAVYYHPAHAPNAAAILDALEGARARFERAYGPLPWRDLRVVEFPRVASFAESFQTTIAFSEGSDFLTMRDPKTVDAISFVVAHEAAHQWFGNLVGADGVGSDLLVEGLAEYAAGTFIEDALGADAAALFRRHEEETYLRFRTVDGEPPLAALEGGYGPHAAVAYQKGGLVLHMLEREIGRARMDAAIAEYVARFGAGRPTVDDLLAILERHAPAGFVEQWFRRVVVPDARLVRASVRRDGDAYVVEAVVTNGGDGRLAVAVEATGEGAAATVATIEAGRETTVEIRCPFAPTRVTVDPRYDALDANRDDNAVELGRAPPE